MKNSRSFGLLYVFKVPEFQFSFFPTSGFWGGTCFLIAPFPDRCLLLPFLYTLSFPLPIVDASYKKLALIDQVHSEEKIFETLDRWMTTDDGSWVYYKLTS